MYSASISSTDSFLSARARLLKEFAPAVRLAVPVSDNLLRARCVVLGIFALLAHLEVTFDRFCAQGNEKCQARADI
jgi:hypothetical protein